jgi:branched-chain amino acid transport system permease protein
MNDTTTSNPTKIWIQKNQKLLTLAFIVILLLLPLGFGQQGLIMRVFNLVIINSLLAMGLMVISGYTGMLNMGHAAFYGIGAYTAAVLALTFNQPFWVCFLAATAAAGLFGFLVAFPCLKVTTDFLSLITIAFAEVFLTVVSNWMDVTRGPMGLPGIPGISLGGHALSSASEIYYFFLAIAGVVYLALHNILHSRVGRSLQAIRDDEICASAQGINIRYYKVLAFVLGTIPAGMAGTMIAFYVQFVGPSMFKFDVSLLIMNMVILGGLGSLPGAIVGALFFVGFTELIRPLAVYRVGVGGLTMILLMLFRPQGIMGSAAFAGGGGLQGQIYRLRQKYLARARLEQAKK